MVAGGGVMMWDVWSNDAVGGRDRVAFRVL